MNKSKPLYTREVTMWKLNQSINKSKPRYTKGVNSVKIKSIYK